MTIFDIEIANTVESVGGWNNTGKMGIGICAMWQSKLERYRIYGERDVDLIREVLRKENEIGGFNIVNFDLPVAFGMEKDEWMRSELRREMLPKCNDILRRIWISLGLNPDIFTKHHAGFKLDTVVQGTLNSKGKIAEGAIAPIWYQEGKVAEVANYCLDDVQLERQLCEFVDRYGYIRLPDGTNLRIKAPKGV